ncbi:MAG: iron ABC transporter permease [Elusimicrobia bacterium]|nr:iron ABC transporter permease [Elusimicrobiota bacterium]
MTKIQNSKFKVQSSLFLILVSGFLFIFLAVPLFTLCLTAFTGKPMAVFERITKADFISLARETTENLTLDPLKDLVRVGRYRKAARNTLLVVVAVATLSSLVALPASVALAGGLFASRGLWGFLLLLPLALHSYLFSFAIILIFGHHGLMERLLGFSLFNPFSVQGLILAQTLAFTPLAILVQTPAFSLYNNVWSAVASSLGSRPALAVGKIWWPLNARAVAAGWLLVGLRSMADFVTPMILTSTRWRLLVLEAWRDLAGSNWWPGAAALSLEMIFICAVFLILEKKSTQRPAQDLPMILGPREHSWGRLSSGMLFVYAALLGVLPVGGCLVMIVASLGLFHSGSWTLDYYREVGPDFLKAMGVSLLLGFLVAVIGNLSGLILAKPMAGKKKAWQGRLMALAAFAFALPSTIYAISLIGVFNRPPLFLHFTPALLILALSATRMNYSIRIISSVWPKLGIRWEDALRASGASGILAWRWATLPYLKGALAAAGALMFISAIQDVGLSILIAPPRFYPLSLVIARNIADGLFAQGAALAIGSMLILLAPLALALKMLGRVSREDFGI